MLREGRDRTRCFFADAPTGVYSYPIPTHGKEVAKHYVRGLRERLGLTAKDGISDYDFYEG